MAMCDAELVHVGDLGRNLVHASVIDSKALAGRQRFAGKLQQDALVRGCRHGNFDVSGCKLSV